MFFYRLRIGAISEGSTIFVYSLTRKDFDNNFYARVLFSIDFPASSAYEYGETCPGRDPLWDPASMFCFEQGSSWTRFTVFVLLNYKINLVVRYNVIIACVNCSYLNFDRFDFLSEIEIEYKRPNNNYFLFVI